METPKFTGTFLKELRVFPPDKKPNRTKMLLRLFGSPDILALQPTPLSPPPSFGSVALRPVLLGGLPFSESKHNPQIHASQPRCIWETFSHLLHRKPPERMEAS